MSINIELGMQPVSNRFLFDSSERAPHYPMGFFWDEKLGCMALIKPFPIDEVRPQFDWITCFEPEDHLDDMVQDIIRICSMEKSTRVVGYSFKDDTTLDRLNKLGFQNTWRIDPKYDLKIVNSFASVETLQMTFTKENAQTLMRTKKKSEIIIARHVVEHAYNIVEYIQSLEEMIIPEGFIVFELPDCERAMLAGDCTILWEEHTAYFTSKSFHNLMVQLGYEVLFEKVYKYPLENSITFIVRKNKHNKFSINSINTSDNMFYVFKTKIEKRKMIIREKLSILRKEKRKIVIFGAGHLTIAFLSINGVADLVDVCIDDNLNKNGMFLPVGGIPIIGSKELNAKDYPVCLLGLNPQHHRNIRDKFFDYITLGGQMLSIFPETEFSLDEL
ncbi:class I SAM-dependent methyltransferase [Alphaproteobacteria bacterium]|nr:class I SAM-dependent methyltransferase [Alphaproteobacteria bacterium]